VWAGHRWYQIFERRYRVASQDLALLEELDGALGVFTVAGHGAHMADTYCVAVDEDYHTFRDCTELLSGPTRQNALATLLADLNQRAVAGFEGFAVHAGVVQLGSRTAAIPVDSGGGKSTLTAALVLAGLQYLSDEGLCIDYDAGVVEPYPKPISLAPWSRKALGLDDGATNGSALERAFSAIQLGGRVGGRGQLTDIVFPIYDDHSTPGITPIPRSDAQARLLRLSFNHFKNPEKAFRLSAELVKAAGCFEFTYSDPMHAAAFLKEHLSS
jgi:hypothetical protein